jgi:methionine-rich copper-binding protein CopC
MSRFNTIFIAGAFAVAAAATGTAQAHAKLESSDPQAGSTLAAAPTHIRLKFNEALEPAFSKIQLTNGSNASVLLPHSAEVDKGDPSVLVAQTPGLRSGTYHVQWATMTHDGHKTKGEFAFRVK